MNNGMKKIHFQLHSSPVTQANMKAPTQQKKKNIKRKN